MVDASDNLRMGIVSFHSGEFNRAILSLEKALTFKPEWDVTKVWLGNSYFKAGFTDEALSYWQNVLSSGGGSTILKVRVDNLLYRRNMGPLLRDDFRYVTYHEIDGITDDYVLFRRPGSLVPADDGGLYVTSFAGNRILKISANGVKVKTILGGLDKINHPFDIIRSRGYLFFTEYGADRVIRTDLDGRHLIRFGSSGSGDGEFLGPQFIAADGYGYLYITDEGNKRVSKYSFDGEYVFSFGSKSDYFEGFSEPTGIVYVNDTVLVADKRKGKLFLFDKSGNYLKSYSSKIMHAPEGISILPDGRFLVADRGGILVFDMNDETFYEVTRIQGQDTLIIKAVLDANRNIVLTDFNRNRILYLADITRMYTGLDVSLDRVVSDDFPKVSVELTVSSLDGTPLVGLEENNFLVTENSYPVPKAELVYSGNKSDITNLSLIIEGSPQVAGNKELKQAALKNLLDVQKGRGTINIVSAEELPVMEIKSTSDSDMLNKALLTGGNYSGRWKFDLGIRLSASSLILKSDRRAVVFLTSGKLPSGSFDHYSLNEVTDYLKNNNIVFYTVYTGDRDSVSPELVYLTEKTGGRLYSLYRPAGIGEVVSDLKSKYIGSYVLTYQSSLDSDFGRKPLPVEVQVSLFGRSGRGESLYYAPLK